jgi:hypothetical protein
MFISIGRIWAGRPAAVVSARERLRIRRSGNRSVYRSRQTGENALDLPAALGASDAELVQVAVPQAMDAADRHRHQAMLMLLTNNGHRGP